MTHNTAHSGSHPWSLDTTVEQGNERNQRTVYVLETLLLHAMGVTLKPLEPPSGNLRNAAVNYGQCLLCFQPILYAEIQKRLDKMDSDLSGMKAERRELLRRQNQSGFDTVIQGRDFHKLPYLKQDIEDLKDRVSEIEHTLASR